MNESLTVSTYSLILGEVQNQTLQDGKATLHERIAEILRHQKLNMTVSEYLSSIAALTQPTYTVQTPATPPTNHNVKDEINWGVILPIGLIGLVLLVFVTCLFWQSWKEKRSMLQFFEQQQHSHENPAYERTIETGMPTRSVGSQVSRGSNTFQPPQAFPQLRRQGSRYFFQVEEETKKGGHLTPRLSPIDESAKHSTTNATTLLGNEDRKAGYSAASVQAGWGTPKTRHTDNVTRYGGMIGMTGYVNPCFSAPGKLAGNVYCEECNVFNSPFYPRITSPETEYDLDSEKSGLLGEEEETLGKVTAGHVRHVVNRPPPCLYGEEISSITNFLENSHYPQHTLGEICHARSISDCGTASLPSSISRFNTSPQSNIPSYPFASTRNCSPLRLNFTLSSSIEASDQCSDNTSLFPCVGSSCTSVWTQAASRTNLLPHFTYDDRRPMLRSSSVPETRHAHLDILPSLNTKETNSGETDLFRTVSITADLSSDSSQVVTSVSCSVSQGTHAHPTPVSANTDTWDQISLGNDQLYENDSVCDNGALPTRKVKFSVPVLVKKQYWV